MAVGNRRLTGLMIDEPSQGWLAVGCNFRTGDDAIALKYVDNFQLTHCTIISIACNASVSSAPPAEVLALLSVITPWVIVRFIVTYHVRQYLNKYIPPKGSHSKN